MEEQIDPMNAVRGKHYSARYATLGDAEFIHQLRLSRGEYLHPTSSDLASQVEYLRNSLELRRKREEAYLVIETSGNVPAGCFRLTGLDSTFTLNYQSLVICDGQSPNLAIDVIFGVYQLAFEYLRKKTVGPFYVLSENKRVIELHRAMAVATQGESIRSDTKEYLQFIASSEAYFARERFFKSLGFGVTEISNDLLRLCGENDTSCMDL